MAALDDDDIDDTRAQRFADNEVNRAIDALFIVAQHDGCKWADECRCVKDLCRATRAETGLWSAMSRAHYWPWKRTLLMYEASHGRLDRVLWLLSRGAPRDARDEYGRTALFWASSNGHADVVRAISSDADVDIADNYGYSPFIVASLHGHTETVRALIAAKAGIDIVDIAQRVLWQA